MNYIILLIILIGIVLGVCYNPVLRKEIRELSDSELRIYINAVNQLHETYVPGTNYSYIDHFAKIHGDYIKFPHGKPPFLVWHRQLVRLYEMELQKIDPRVILPYWDWTLDSQAPELSPILTSKYIGGNGNSNQHHCVTDGPFKNWILNYPDKHCLKRKFSMGNRISPFMTPEELHLYMNEPNYSDLSLMLEEKHGYVHGFIGGDVKSIYSPSDPLFFLHHTFVDMIFYNWQKRHPHANYEGSRFHKLVNPNDWLPPFNLRAKDTWDINHQRYCYTYPTYPRPIFNDISEFDREERLRDLEENNPILYGPLYHATISEAINLLPSIINNLPSTPFDSYSPYSRTLKIPSYFPTETLIKVGFNVTEFRSNTKNSDKLRKLLDNYPNFVSLANLNSPSSPPSDEGDIEN